MPATEEASAAEACWMLEAAQDEAGRASLAAGSKHPLLLLLDAIKPGLLCISQSTDLLEQAACQHVLQDCSHQLCSSRGDAEDTEANSIHLLQASNLKLTSTAREAAVTQLLSLSAVITDSV